MSKTRDTHTERHATLYGCLPSLLGDGDIYRNWNSVWWGKIFCTEPTTAARADEKSLVPARQAQWTTKKMPCRFDLFWFLFTPARLFQWLLYYSLSFQIWLDAPFKVAKKLGKLVQQVSSYLICRAYLNNFLRFSQKYSTLKYLS